jgi:hypothetical protein
MPKVSPAPGSLEQALLATSALAISARHKCVSVPSRTRRTGLDRIMSFS